jgi:hypothetical protein
VCDDDLRNVLALNAANVEMLAPMDADRFRRLREWSDRFSVIESEGAFAGFVVTFASGSGYDSVNYRWFSERYEDFYYLDRIVLLPEARRLGLGTRAYAELERLAARHGRMALEVNLVPRNDASLAFHASRGYVEVGRLGDDGHLVSLMTKELG